MNRPETFTYKGVTFQPALAFSKNKYRRSRQLGGNIPLNQSRDKLGRRLYILPGGREATAQDCRDYVDYQRNRTDSLDNRSGYANITT